MKARSVSAVIAGEAASGTPEERFNDMLHIASVIKNRADMLGVTPEQVIAADNQFDAYNSRLPTGVDGEIVDMAAKAWDQVNTTGPVTNATFYATPSAVDNLPSGLEATTETAGHQYFTDPEFRSIATTQGYVKPNPTLMSEVVQPAIDQAQNVASSAYDTTAGLLSGAWDTSADMVGKAGGMGMGLLDRAAATVQPVTAMLSKTPPTGYDPANDLGLGPENLPSVDYSMGRNRPFAPDQSIIDVAQQAADSVLGSGSKVTVTSGTEGQGLAQFGSNRHKTGLAADVTFTTPQGTVLSWKNPADLPALQDIAQSAAAIGGQNLSVGLGYQNAPHMMHLDTVPSLTPGQDREWGVIGNQMADTLALARNEGVMPASYYDQVAANVTQNNVTPSLLDRSSLQINQPDQMMAAVNPPVDNSVVRTGLPDVQPSTGILSGWQDMATANQANPAVAAIDAQMPKQAMPSYSELSATAPSANAIVTGNVEEYGPKVVANEELNRLDMANFSLPASSQMLSSATQAAANPGLLASSVPMSLPAVPTATGQEIAGPATTEIASAPVQAAKTAVTQAVKEAEAPVKQASEQPGWLNKVNETLGTNLTQEGLGAGVLGNMFGGPVVGIGAGLLGNYIAKNGGIAGLFSGLGSPISVNNIGGGYQNVQSVYSGRSDPGTQATASNGARVTSLPGGRVAYTNSYGTTTISNADGTGQGSYFGDTKF